MQTTMLVVWGVFSVLAATFGKYTPEWWRGVAILLSVLTWLAVGMECAP